MRQSRFKLPSLFEPVQGELLLEGSSKQFGEEDKRQLKTGESGKKRWHSIQEEIFPKAQLDLFNGQNRWYSVKDRNTVQATLLTNAVPPEDHINYVLDSSADGKKLGKYADAVIDGKLTEKQAIEKVQEDYDKMKNGEKEAPHIQGAKSFLEFREDSIQKLQDRIKEKPQFKDKWEKVIAHYRDPHNVKADGYSIKGLYEDYRDNYLMFQKISDDDYIKYLDEAESFINQSGDVISPRALSEIEQVYDSLEVDPHNNIGDDDVERFEILRRQNPIYIEEPDFGSIDELLEYVKRKFDGIEKIVINESNSHKIAISKAGFKKVTRNRFDIPAILSIASLDEALKQAQFIFSERTTKQRKNIIEFNNYAIKINIGDKIYLLRLVTFVKEGQEILDVFKFMDSSPVDIIEKPIPEAGAVLLQVESGTGFKYSPKIIKWIIGVKSKMQSGNMKKSIILFGKSFGINVKPQGQQQLNMFGQERVGHKYIKKEMKNGKMIYYYKMPDGSIKASNEDGTELDGAEPETQQLQKPNIQPVGAGTDQLDLFANKVFENEQDVQAELQTEENKKLKREDYSRGVEHDYNKAQTLMGAHYNIHNDIASELGLQIPSKDNAIYFLKPESFLYDEIGRDNLNGKGAVSDGGYIHHFIDGKGESIVSEYEKRGFKVTPNKEKYCEPEFNDLLFDKYIMEKDGERLETWVMGKELYDAYVQTQQMPVRLKETKTSLGLKIEAEKTPELPEVKKYYMQNGARVKENQKIYVIGGLPASGKSSVMGKSLQRGKVVVDPDAVKYIIGDIRGTSKHDIDTEPWKYHEESSTIGKHMIREMMREGKQSIFDVTMKGSANIGDLLTQAHSAGVKTWAKFIHIPINVGIERDKARKERGGRGIGKELYTELYSKYPTHQTFFGLLPDFDRADLFDNSRPKGNSALKVYQKKEDGEKILNKNRYRMIQSVGKGFMKALKNRFKRNRIFA